MAVQAADMGEHEGGQEEEEDLAHEIDMQKWLEEDIKDEPLLPKGLCWNMEQSQLPQHNQQAACDVKDGSL